MLAKLKVEVGIEATNKMEQMFRDIRYSEELQNMFEESLPGHDKEIEGVAFNIKVLARAKWPTMDALALQQLPR